MYVCNKCKKTINDRRARFCPNCGAPLDFDGNGNSGENGGSSKYRGRYDDREINININDNRSGQVENPGYYNGYRKKKSRFPVVITVISLLIAAIAIIGYMAGNDSEKAALKDDSIDSYVTEGSSSESSDNSSDSTSESGNTAEYVSRGDDVPDEIEYARGDAFAGDYFLAQDVYLRSTPTLYADNKICKVYAGNTVHVLNEDYVPEKDSDGRERLWIKVKTDDGKIGYVSNRAIDCTDRKPNQ